MYVISFTKPNGKDLNFGSNATWRKALKELDQQNFKKWHGDKKESTRCNNLRVLFNRFSGKRELVKELEGVVAIYKNIFGQKDKSNLWINAAVETICEARRAKKATEAASAERMQKCMSLFQKEKIYEKARRRKIAALDADESFTPGGTGEQEVGLGFFFHIFERAISFVFF
jgi:hypothetical protein